MTSETEPNNLRDGRRILPSLEYWRAAPERLPQRFYIAFCLLMSSVQDFILGQRSRSQIILTGRQPALTTLSSTVVVLYVFSGWVTTRCSTPNFEICSRAVKHDSAAMFTHSIGCAASRISVTIVGISPDRRSISSRDDRSLPKPSQRCRRSPASHELGQGAWTSL